MTTLSTTHSIQYGTATIHYHLDYATRKTLAISVHPDLRVTVTAPHDSVMDEIEARVRKRAPWILRQQRDFERYLPHLPPRQYVSGETHRYLGRQYRLKVIEGGDDQVKLKRGRFFIHVHDRGDTGRVQALLDGWYRRQARRVFKERLDACYPRAERLGAPYPEIAIRVLKTRWGSCSSPGRIALNLKLIQVPKLFIDYVVMHELCHLVEPNHSPAFYALLDRAMPDWRERKNKLDEYEFG
ncbi:MAG: M48 family metallopeptidase [Anaerolineae bacterium]|nr:M48 family metallopeptidase [Anaerolineae bacterium]